MNQSTAQPKFYFPPNLVQFFKPRPFSSKFRSQKKKKCEKIFLLKKKKKIQVKKYIKEKFCKKSLNTLIIKKKKKEFKLVFNFFFPKRTNDVFVVGLCPVYVGKRLLNKNKKSMKTKLKLNFSLNFCYWIIFWGSILLKLKLKSKTIKEQIKFFSKILF